MLTHLTAKSSNAKTGPIAVSTSSRKQCPDSCPLKGNGCYADSGPLALHWRKVTNGERGLEWLEFLQAIQALPDGRQFRHNQAGDIVDPSTLQGAGQLAQLTAATQGRTAWTYTHHKLNRRGLQAVKAATANGFTVNKSCQSELEADLNMRLGIRSVFIVRSDETRTAWTTEGGNRAVVCPAQRFEAMTCERCGLCAKRPSNVAIAFLAHGTHRKKTEAVL